MRGCDKSPWLLCWGVNSSQDKNGRRDGHTAALPGSTPALAGRPIPTPTAQGALRGWWRLSCPILENGNQKLPGRGPLKALSADAAVGARPTESPGQPSPVRRAGGRSLTAMETHSLSVGDKALLSGSRAQPLSAGSKMSVGPLQPLPSPTAPRITTGRGRHSGPRVQWPPRESVPEAPSGECTWAIPGCDHSGPS